MSLFAPGNIRTPIFITALEQTCGACPSQWEGETSDGAAVYIRYRHGQLTVQVGPGIDAAIDRPPVFTWRGDEGGGWMSTERLREVLPPSIVLTDAAMESVERQYAAS